MLLHAIVHGDVCTHVRESALKADWEKNPLPHREIEPVGGLTLYKLSYIPNPGRAESSKNGFEMHFECEFSPFRIQTFTQSHPRKHFTAREEETISFTRDKMITVKQCEI